MSMLRKLLKSFRQGMKGFVQNLGCIVNSIILLPVYIVGVGATSILAKLFGKRFLQRGPSKKGKTYWSELNLEKNGIENYYRQF